MADLVNPFADWKPEGSKEATTSVKKGVEVENPFADWKPEKEKSKPGTKENPLKGAVDFADKAMSAIGVDLRTKDGTTRKPKNWLEEGAQGIAKASREETNEQQNAGPARSFGAKSIGAATGIPRLAEDLRNASKGAVYGAGEGIRKATGINPVETIRAAAHGFDGQPIAPALQAVMELSGLSEPTHYMEKATKSLGDSTGMPATIESGQTDIVNAIPVGVGGNAAGKGIRAAYKAGAGAGAAMGALAGGQVAGRETAQTGKTFNPQNVAREAAKSAIVGGVAGGIIHGSVNGFGKVPKSINTKPEAHARDTIVSKKPIEPQTTGEKAFDRALRASEELKQREKELADLGAKGDYDSIVGTRKVSPVEMDAILGTTPNAVHPGAARALKGSRRINGPRAQREAQATDHALEVSAELLPLEKTLGRMEKPRVTVSREVAKSGLESPNEILDAADVKHELGAEQLAPEPTEMAPVDGELPSPEKLAPKEPVKSPDVQPDVEELRATAADKKNKTAEQRRQAKLKLKEVEKAKPKETEAPPARYTKVDTDKPKTPMSYEEFVKQKNESRNNYNPQDKAGKGKRYVPPQSEAQKNAYERYLTEFNKGETPSAPPPKEDGIITRAEFKRRTVQSRTATPEEVTRYSEIAEDVAEHDYHQRRYEAGLKQLAEELKVQQPTKMMRGSHEKALSPESGELNTKVAAAISKMRELAGHSDEPTIDVYDKTFMGEHKIEPLKGANADERWIDLENTRISADEIKKRLDKRVEAIKGEWKTRVDDSYKVDDTTYIPVEVTAGDGTKHHVNVVTKRAGDKKGMTKKQAEAYALKDVQSRYGSTKEGAHPRAINVPTSRGDVLLESYKRKSPFTQSELKKAETVAGDNPAFQEAKQQFLELKPKRDAAGEYPGVDYPKLHEILTQEMKRFFSEESGSGRAGIVLDVGDAAKDVANIFATHVWHKNKAAIEDFLADRAVQREFQGSSDKTKLQRMGDVIRTALAMKNDMDWVRGYSPELAHGLEAIRSQMEHLGQGIKPLESSIQAREEFVRASDMTPQAVRDHKWQHLSEEQANFIADISELRAEAADMISDTYDNWHDEGRSHSIEARHMKGLYAQYTGGVDINTGLRVPKRAFEKVLDHLQTGIYDALVTGNKRIHSLHVVDALTMGTSVVHPTNLMRAAHEFAINPEVREFLSSYQGTGVYKQTRGSKLSLYEKSLGKAIELSAERIFGKKGVEALRKLEGGWLEKYKIDFIRGAAIMRAGKEMGYKGNLLADVAREYKSGKPILSPVERTELSIRVLNQLEDAFGYNPAGFVNRNAFRMLHLDSLFPFMGIRSVQNRLLGKFIAERNPRALLTLVIATHAFAGSAGLMKPVEDALKFAAPEAYIQVKHVLDFLSLAGVAEAGLKATGVMNEGNEQAIGPFLRRIEHIQPEVIPWLYNTPKILMDVFNTSDTSLRTNIVRLSALMGGSSIAGITTPTELEALWRRLEKGRGGEVTTDSDGKLIGGKKMAVYERRPFGEKNLGTKQHVPTTAFREFMNHILPQEDVIDERYTAEAKFGAAVKTQLMRNGYDQKEITKIMKHFYQPIHAAKRAADSHDFIKLLREHPKK